MLFYFLERVDDECRWWFVLGLVEFDDEDVEVLWWKWRDWRWIYEILSCEDEVFFKL